MGSFFMDTPEPAESDHGNDSTSGEAEITHNDKVGDAAKGPTGISGADRRLLAGECYCGSRRRLVDPFGNDE